MADSGGSTRDTNAALWVRRHSNTGAPTQEPVRLQRRTTSWVSPTTGAHASVSRGIGVAGTPEGAILSSYHSADSQPSTYIAGY